MCLNDDCRNSGSQGLQLWPSKFQEAVFKCCKQELNHVCLVQPRTIGVCLCCASWPKQTWCAGPFCWTSSDNWILWSRKVSHRLWSRGSCGSLDVQGYNLFRSQPLWWSLIYLCFKKKSWAHLLTLWMRRFPRDCHESTSSRFTSTSQGG
jgi:hypothetical protein